MSTTVSILNVRPNGFAHPEFARIAPLTSKTKTLKQVNADNYSSRYDSLAAFGVAVSENGSLRPGATVITNTYTILSTDYVVIADLAGVTKVVTLPVSGSLTDGRKMWVILRSTSGGDVTLTAGAGDTILGGANVTMTGAGAVRRIQLSGTDWIAQ